MAAITVAPSPVDTGAPEDLELVANSDDLMTMCVCSAGDDHPA